MAYVQADLDRLNSALTAGVLTVEIEGKRVTYRSVNELLTVIARVERSLLPTTTIPKQFRFKTRSGF